MVTDGRAVEWLVGATRSSGRWASDVRVGVGDRGRIALPLTTNGDPHEVVARDCWCIYILGHAVDHWRTDYVAPATAAYFFFFGSGDGSPSALALG